MREIVKEGEFDLMSELVDSALHSVYIILSQASNEKPSSWLPPFEVESVTDTLFSDEKVQGYFESPFPLDRKWAAYSRFKNYGAHGQEIYTDAANQLYDKLDLLHMKVGKVALPDRPDGLSTQILFIAVPDENFAKFIRGVHVRCSHYGGKRLDNFEEFLDYISMALFESAAILLRKKYWLGEGVMLNGEKNALRKLFALRQDFPALNFLYEADKCGNGDVIGTYSVSYMNLPFFLSNVASGKTDGGARVISTGYTSRLLVPDITVEVDNTIMFALRMNNNYQTKFVLSLLHQNLIYFRDFIYPSIGFPELSEELDGVINKVDDAVSRVCLPTEPRTIN